MLSCCGTDFMHSEPGRSCWGPGLGKQTLSWGSAPGAVTDALSGPCLRQVGSPWSRLRFLRTADLPCHVLCLISDLRLTHGSDNSACPVSQRERPATTVNPPVEMPYVPESL